MSGISPCRREAQVLPGVLGAVISCRSSSDALRLNRSRMQSDLLAMPRGLSF